MIELYTVEYEELRTGHYWFKVVEAFRTDDSLMKAQKRAIQLWGKAIYRNVEVIPWCRAEKKIPEFDSKYPVASKL